MTLTELRKHYPTLQFKKEKQKFLVSRDNIKWYGFGNIDTSFKHFTKIFPTAERIHEAMSVSDHDKERKQNFVNKLHKHKERFNAIFHKNIFDFINYFLWTFNILRLEHELQLQDYDGSMSDGIATKYGEEARQIVLEMIHHD